MSKTILLRPLFTEKTEANSADGRRFSFVVAKDANKHQIRVAVEEQFDVRVKEVNTLRMPAKLKTRFTKRGLQKGRRNAFKKAVVTLREGQTFDFFTEA